METAVRLGDNRSHAQLEAIPVSAQQFSRAPIMFKKVKEELHRLETAKLSPSLIIHSADYMCRV